jgi:uncharacterized protein (TIGR03067 family)
MRLAHNLLLCIVTVVIGCFAYHLAPTSALAAKDNAPSDQDQILGTWEIVSSHEAGKDVSETYRAMKVVFTRDRLKLMPKDQTQDALQLKYKLDPMKKPKHIDTTHELDPGKPISQLGIYELDGDNLKICLEAADRGRPDKFETKPNGSAHLMVLRRAKK